MLKRLKSVSTLLFLMGVSTGTAYAVAESGITDVKITQQNGSCTGIVKDTTGETVIGASVVVKGTTNGTITGIDGDFSLNNVKQGDIIQISFVGYKTVEVKWNGQPLNVTLKDDTEMLGEVVVTGYGGQQLRTKVTNSISKVKQESLNVGMHSNPAQALSGAVAGLKVIQSSGSPGATPTIILRGGTNLDGTGSPLVVVDGQLRDSMSDINPEDIESISMLTGPSAAALYGNAAASGVVLITTKKGAVGKTSVTVSNNTTFSKVSMLPEMQSKYGNVPNSSSSWGEIVNSSYDPKDFFRTGANIINNVSLSTGNQKNQTYFSASTPNTTNILPNSGYNRYNFTLRNTTSFLNDKMTLDMGASYIIQNDKNMVSQGYYNNPLPAVYRFPRSENFDDVRMYERYNSLYDLMEQYWPYGETSSGLANPYWIQNRQIRENHKTRYMINTSLKYKILDWFDVTGRVKIDNYENRYTYKAYASTGQLSSGDRGSYTDIWSQSKNIYADVIGTVNKRINDWSINVNMGASLNDSRYETIGYDGGLKQANFFAVHNINFKEAWKAKQSGWHDQTRALFISAEVGWKSMLYLTATGRNDWDSRLAFSDYKSFFYPSVGLLFFPKLFPCLNGLLI